MTSTKDGSMAGLMKWIGVVFRSFTCASVTFAVAVCHGQGYFEFSNLGISPIFGPDTNDVYLQQWGNPPDGIPPGNQIYTGPRLAGTNYSVDATYSLEPVTDGFELRLDFLQVPVPPKRFSGVFPGFFFGGEVYMPGATNLYLQVRAWDNAGGGCIRHGRKLGRRPKGAVAGLSGGHRSFTNH